MSDNPDFQSRVSPMIMDFKLSLMTTYYDPFVNQVRRLTPI